MFQVVVWTRNRSEVLSSIFGHRKLTRLVLRSGLVIEAPENVQLWNHFNDIWLNQTYTSGGFGIPRASVVIDIGANIGLFSLLAASRAASVLSYEPHLPTFSWLVRNTEGNRMRNIRAHNSAVAGRSGSRAMYVGNECTANSLFPQVSTGDRGLEQVAVECVTLAEILEGMSGQGCGFLKLDCEGAEFEILLETPGRLLRLVERISLECHEGRTSHTHLALTEHLRSIGFATSVDQVSQQTAMVRARNVRWWGKS